MTISQPDTISASIGREHPLRPHGSRSGERPVLLFVWGVPQVCPSMALTRWATVSRARSKPVTAMAACNGKAWASVFWKVAATDSSLAKNSATRTGRDRGQRGTRGRMPRGDTLTNDRAKRGLRHRSPNAAVGDRRSAQPGDRRQRPELLHRTLIVRESRLPDPHRLFDSPDIRVKIRGIGRNPEGFASIRPDGHERLHVELTDAAWAPAKGNR